MNILVSTICFLNYEKKNAEIYGTFANRLISDVIHKTPFDIRVATNARKGEFDEMLKSYPNRVSLYHNDLSNNKIQITVFNQILKFNAIKEVDPKYDYVFYLDCDNGFAENVNINEIDIFLNKENRFRFKEFLALRTNCVYKDEYVKHLEYIKDPENVPKPLFTDKFTYYGYDEKYNSVILPSEHLLFIKNDERLPVMAKNLEDFCNLFEQQTPDTCVTEDMESFEIGISAFDAGYKIEELTFYGERNILKNEFNKNNLENVKL